MRYIRTPSVRFPVCLPAHRRIPFPTSALVISHLAFLLMCPDSCSFLLWIISVTVYSHCKDLRPVVVLYRVLPITARYARQTFKIDIASLYSITICYDLKYNIDDSRFRPFVHQMRNFLTSSVRPILLLCTTWRRGLNEQKHNQIL